MYKYTAIGWTVVESSLEQCHFHLKAVKDTSSMLLSALTKHIMTKCPASLQSSLRLCGAERVGSLAVWQFGCIWFMQNYYVTALSVQVEPTGFDIKWKWPSASGGAEQVPEGLHWSSVDAAGIRSIISGGEKWENDGHHQRAGRAMILSTYETPFRALETSGWEWILKMDWKS